MARHFCYSLKKIDKIRLDDLTISYLFPHPSWSFFFFFYYKRRSVFRSFQLLVSFPRCRERFNIGTKISAATFAFTALPHLDKGRHVVPSLTLAIRTNADYGSVILKNRESKRAQSILNGSPYTINVEKQEIQYRCWTCER